MILAITTALAVALLVMAYTFPIAQVPFFIMSGVMWIAWGVVMLNTPFADNTWLTTGLSMFGFLMAVVCFFLLLQKLNQSRTKKLTDDEEYDQYYRMIYEKTKKKEPKYPWSEEK